MRSEDEPIVLSSGNENSYKFKIPPRLIDFSIYEKNPILLYNHKKDEVIGRMYDLRRDGQGVPSMRMKFSGTELGQMYKTMYMEGSLNAVSIGGSLKLNKDKSIAEKFTVVEVSLVPQPSDYSAVAPSFGDFHYKTLSSVGDDAEYFSHYEQYNFSLNNKSVMLDDDEKKDGDGSFKGKISEMFSNFQKSLMQLLAPEKKDDSGEGSTISDDTLKTGSDSDGLSGGGEGKLDNILDDVAGGEEDRQKKEEVYEREKEESLKKETKLASEKIDVALAAKVAKVVEVISEAIEGNTDVTLAEKVQEVVPEPVEGNAQDGSEYTNLSTLKETPILKGLTEEKVKLKNQAKEQVNLSDLKKTSNNKNMPSRVNSIPNGNIFQIIQKECRNSGEDVSAALKSIQTHMLSCGNEETLMYTEAIKATGAGKGFYDQTNFSFNNQNGVSVMQTLSSKEYLDNHLDISSQYMSLSASSDSRAGERVLPANISLDRITYLNIAFLEMFASNLFVSRMNVLPMTNINNGVGMVYSNVSFTPNITTRTAGFYSANPEIAYPVASYSNQPKQIQIYELHATPTLFTTYNEQAIAGDYKQKQISNILGHLSQRAHDSILHLLASDIQNIQDNNVALKLIYKATGVTSAPNGSGILWPKLLSNTSSYKGIGFEDLLNIDESYLAQNIDTSVHSTVFLIDGWMGKSITLDPKVSTILTRAVSGGFDNNSFTGNGLKINNSHLLKRSFNILYDTATNSVLMPDNAPTATTVQAGLALTPEHCIVGISDFDIVSQPNSAQFHGELFSVKMKIGAGLAYNDAKGASIILPG